MGLLDRWSKKKKEEILEKQSETKTDEKSVKESKTVATKKTVAKTALKRTAKTVSASKVTAEGVKSPEQKVAKIKSNILVRPLVTEKSAVKQSENKYSFVVVNAANKAAVKQAVFEVYGVKPTDVNILNVQGKFVRFGNHYGKRSDYKKAVVTLPKGKTIVVHEGV